jgi:hypothetical protein
MTSDQQPIPSPYPPAGPPWPRRRPHPGLRAAGLVQVVVTAVAAFGYVLVGIGVGMCTDSGSSAYCRRVDTDYSLAGWALLLNGVLGLGVVLAVEKQRGRRAGRVLAVAMVVALVLLAVTGGRLRADAAGPIG